MNDPAQSQVADDPTILVPTARAVRPQLRPAGGAGHSQGFPQNQEAAIAFVKWFTSKQFQMARLYERGAAHADLGEDVANDASKLEAATSWMRVEGGRAAVRAGHAALVSAVAERGKPAAINRAAKGEVTVDQAMQNVADAAAEGHGAVTTVAVAGGRGGVAPPAMATQPSASSW